MVANQCHVVRISGCGPNVNIEQHRWPCAGNIQSFPGKNQKALLWDGHILAVKSYDSSDEAQQWTWDGEFFVLPKKYKCSWSLKVKASVEVCVTCWLGLCCSGHGTAWGAVRE